MARTLGKLMRSKDPQESPSAPMETTEKGQTFYNFDQITPRRVRWILQRADSAGRVDFLYKLYDDMEVTDTRYGALVDQLRSTVAGMPLRVQPAEGRSEKEKEVAQEYAEYAGEAIRHIDEQKTTESFVNPYIHGAGLYKLDWELRELPYNRSMYVPTKIRQIEGKYLTQNIESEEESFGEIQVLLDGDGTYTPVSELPYDNHIFLQKGDGERHYSRMGKARKALPWFLGLRFVQSWWVQYIEKHGSPTRVAKYPRTSKKSERMQMKKFLQQVGRNGYGLFPQGMEVQLMHASNTGQVTTYSDFLEYGHKEYSILLLGQAGTTGEGEGGAYAQSVVLNGIRQDIISNVGKMSSKGYQHLIDKGLRLNYGEDYKPHLLPDVKPILLNSTDAREKARAAQIVSTKMGVAVPERHVYEHILGVEKPKEGEMTVMHGERFEFGVDDEPEPKMNQQSLGSNAPADSAEAPEDTERSGNENESQDQGRSSQA